MLSIYQSRLAHQSGNAQAIIVKRIDDHWSRIVTFSNKHRISENAAELEQPMQMDGKYWALSSQETGDIWERPVNSGLSTADDDVDEVYKCTNV